MRERAVLALARGTACPHFCMMGDGKCTDGGADKLGIKRLEVRHDCVGCGWPWLRSHPYPRVLHRDLRPSCRTGNRALLPPRSKPPSPWASPPRHPEYHSV